MKQVFKVDENVCKELQEKQVAAEATKSVISGLLESHAMDNSGVIVDSPVFRRYEEQYAERFAAFDKAKQEMFEGTVPAELRARAVNWNLDYTSAELTLQL